MVSQPSLVGHTWKLHVQTSSVLNLYRGSRNQDLCRASVETPRGSSAASETAGYCLALSQSVCTHQFGKSRARVRSQVDRFVPPTQRVNLRTVGEPKGGRARKPGQPWTQNPLRRTGSGAPCLPTLLFSASRSLPLIDSCQFLPHPALKPNRSQGRATHSAGRSSACRASPAHTST